MDLMRCPGCDQLKDVQDGLCETCREADELDRLEQQDLAHLRQYATLRRYA